MGKSKDKKASREAKEDRKLVLGVKKQQLKRKKDRVLERAVDSEPAAEHGLAEDKELARGKKIALLKQKKKTKHAKVKSSHARDDGVVELLSDSKDDATPKLKKKKSKKKLIESSSPVKVYESSVVSDDAGAPKLKKKKRKVKAGKSSAGISDAEEILHENQDEETQSADINQLAAQSENMDNEGPAKSKRGKKSKAKEVRSGKAKKTDKHASSKENNLERHVEVGTANANEIPSVDEDSSRGMKKWILEYKQNRPGLKVLQERIDEFIVAHEEQQEKERKEREARAAEDGWTVVVHHKGRKKTTDTETGTAVGSVSLVAMQEKMAKKKPKEVDANFYRFQKREAHLSELAMLQSKFEQDKKRIQELRAQRKFKPY
ncbi:calponin homology domain-containing protein DDB_G0272472 isoform X1 [Setaria italica]|nr:calponin homology domain-containing protein DDB_G0272472 isoform X1 [Setaria italica]